MLKFAVSTFFFKEESVTSASTYITSISAKRSFIFEFVASL